MSAELLPRFLSHVRFDLAGCWVWTGARDWDGYGMFWLTGPRTVRAHRWLFERIHGLIPAPLQCDHLCRNRACVRPSHIEPVTASENTRRGLSPQQIAQFHLAKTHCPHGHPYDEANTRRYKGGRWCRACNRERNRRRRAAQ